MHRVGPNALTSSLLGFIRKTNSKKKKQAKVILREGREKRKKNFADNSLKVGSECRIRESLNTRIMYKMFYEVCSSLYDKRLPIVIYFVYF